MKQIPFYLLLLLLLNACTPTPTPPPSPTPFPTTPPADFQLIYTESNGALPPPYAYRYTITLNTTQESEISYRIYTDRGDDIISTESFSLEANQLTPLYDTLLAINAFTQPWDASDDPPDGGSTDKLQITAYGQQLLIPPFVQSEHSAEIKALYQQIEAAVPAEIWHNLETLRAQHIAENEDEETEEEN